VKPRIVKAQQLSLMNCAIALFDSNDDRTSSKQSMRETGKQIAMRWLFFVEKAMLAPGATCLYFDSSVNSNILK
jgi:hypothetical protein